MAKEGQFWAIIFGLVLFATFTWLIITVAVDFGAEYGVSSDEIGEGAYDVVEYRDAIKDVESSSETYRTRFESGDVDDIDDPSGLFSVATDMINLVTTPYTLLGKVAYGLGVPSLFVSVVLGLLGVLLILSIWRILRSGS